MGRKKEIAVPRHGYSVPDTAASLGLSVNRVWQMVNDGTLPSVRVGRRVIVPAKAVDDFMTPTPAKA